MNQLSDNNKKLIEVLRKRFEENSNRHETINWDDVQSKLEVNSKKLYSLSEMERTGGEPDVIGIDVLTNEYIFCDCSKESPIGRRSLCYDRKALESRKKNKPQNNVLDTANEMGIKLLSEAEYRELQQLEHFDTKTSSWIFTPADIRKLGGAIFSDFRYGKVFVYHNGADSYYSSRGFRGTLRV